MINNTLSVNGHHAPLEKSITPRPLNDLHPNRIGCFRVAIALARTQWRLLVPIMHQVVVVSATIREEIIEYVAYSDRFDEVSEDEPVPVYMVDAKKEHGEVRVDFTRLAAAPEEEPEAPTPHG